MGTVIELCRRVASTSPSDADHCPGCGPERVERPEPRRPPGRGARPADAVAALAAATHRRSDVAEPPPVDPRGRRPHGLRVHLAAHRRRGAGRAARLGVTPRSRTSSALPQRHRGVVRGDHASWRRSARSSVSSSGLVAMGWWCVRRVGIAHPAPPPQPLVGLTLRSEPLARQRDRRARRASAITSAAVRATV